MGFPDVVEEGVLRPYDPLDLSLLCICKLCHNSNTAVYACMKGQLKLTYLKIMTVY